MDDGFIRQRADEGGYHQHYWRQHHERYAGHDYVGDPFPRSAKRKRSRSIFERVAAKIRPPPCSRFPHRSSCEPAVRAPTLFTRLAFSDQETIALDHWQVRGSAVLRSRHGFAPIA